MAPVLCESVSDIENRTGDVAIKQKQESSKFDKRKLTTRKPEFAKNQKKSKTDKFYRLRLHNFPALFWRGHHPSESFKNPTKIIAF